MKVFLSWSKDRSKEVALQLQDWLPNVIQVARPFMSDRSIASGTFHHEALRSAIAGAEYCIVCVTPENASEPWLNYEAGAIVEKLNGNTCPYLFGDIERCNQEFYAVYECVNRELWQTLVAIHLLSSAANPSRMATTRALMGE